MRNIILSLLLVTAFTCQRIEIPWKFSVNILRCENDEVVCYYFTGSYKAGMSCKFKINKKELKDD